ncbi:hypothetical protein Leryth_018373 [Lithospermum erythrorhizon]|nr:hypothetical protein Leryth_018373 [Lithospermum erythrorhizon]
MSKSTSKKEIQGLILDRYEIGKLLGQGTFAKVYLARNIKSNESVAIKVIDKEKILKVGLIGHIKREISILRRVRQSQYCSLEVMATKSKIFFIMEYVRGGELFNKVAKGRLKEEVARRYFQQLISAVSFCHARGVYHRDLKPENILLDEDGNLKVSDFGLSAILPDQINKTYFCRLYVAPEVLGRKGLLDINPETRITIPEIMNHRWFKKGFKQVKFYIEDDKLCSVNEEVDDAIDSCSEPALLEPESEIESRRKLSRLPRPASLNAFDIISFSPGFDLSGLFDEGGEGDRKKDCRISLEGSREGAKGPLAIAAEIFELTPSLRVVEVKKKGGDKLEYEEFCNRELKPGLLGLQNHTIDDIGCGPFAFRYE